MIRAEFLQIDGRVHAVDIALVQLPAQQFNGFTEPLEMDDLPFPEELDDIIDIGVVAQAQNVVIGDPRLLLWHNEIKATIIYRNIGNKRLIVIKKNNFCSILCDKKCVYKLY